MRSVDEWRFANQPLQLRSAEILQDVALPDHGAVDSEARQVAVFAEQVRYRRSPSTVGVPRGPAPRAVRIRVSIGPSVFDHTSLPSARLSAMTTLVEPLRALDEDAVTGHGHRSIAGPESVRGPNEAWASGGPSLRSPVSFDMRVRSGPCHCGQSGAALSTATLRHTMRANVRVLFKLSPIVNIEPQLITFSSLG